MANPTSQKTKVCVPGLLEAIPEPLAQDILAAAVKIYGKNDVPLSAQLKEILYKKNKGLKMHEDNRGKANPGQVRRAIEGVWLDHEDLATVVLESWATLNSKLVNCCTVWIKENQENIFTTLGDLGDVQGKKSFQADSLQDIVIEITKKHPNIGSQEEFHLGVMIVLKDLVKTAKLMIENPPNNPEPCAEARFKPVVDNAYWKEVLEKLEQIPAEDPRWDTFENFLQAAQVIVNAKREQNLRKQKVQRINEVLGLYHQDFLTRAEYFQVQGVDGWNADCVAEEQVEAVVEALEELHNRLVELDRLEQLPVPSIRAERLILENDRRQAEDFVIAGYETTQAFFSFPSRPEPPGEVNLVPSETDLPSALGENGQENLATLDAEESSTVEEPAETVEIKLPSEQGQAEVPLAAKELALQQAATEEPGEETVESDSPGPESSDVLIKAVIDENRLEETSETTEELEDTENQAVFESEDESPFEPEIRVQLEASSDERHEPEVLGAKQPEALPVVLFDLANSQPISELQANADLIWRLECNDLSSAYWLTWGMEEQNLHPKYPSWLLAAVQGAAWSIDLWPDPSHWLLDSVCELVQPDKKYFDEKDKASIWLSLAAGVYFSLIDPLGRWETWLNSSALLPNTAPINTLIGEIVEAGRMGVRLDPTSVQLVVNEESVEEHVRGLSAKARQWLTQSQSRRARFPRAQLVWQELNRPGKGELYKLIDLVAADRRQAVDEVSDQLAKWRDRVWLDKNMQKIDQELNQRKIRAIVGEARDQLIGWVEDITIIAQDWCQSVKAQEEAKQGRNWMFNQVKSLCEKLGLLLDAACANLEDLKASEKDAVVLPALAMVEQSFRGLSTILSPTKGTKYLVSNAPGFNIKGGHGSLVEKLAYPLVYYPELVLKNNGLPGETQAEKLVAVLTQVQDRTRETAIQLWISLGDYRFTDVLLDGMTNREIWEMRVREALRNDVLRLEQKDIEETVVAIEQALLEGLIAETEYTEYRSSVESVRKQIRQIDISGGRSISLRQYGTRLFDIRERLSIKRQERVASQKAHWQEILPKLPQVFVDDQLLCEGIERTIARSIEDGDLRATGEYLVHLENALSSGKVPEKSLFEGRSLGTTQPVIEFQSLLPGYVSLLEPRTGLQFSRIRDAFANNEPLPQIPMDTLPKPRREEVVRALEAWRRLKLNGQYENQGNIQHIMTLISFFGFTLAGQNPVSAHGPITGMPNFQHWRVSAQAEGFSPVAQFGSLRKGHYDILGVWDRPGIEVINALVSSLMQQNGNQPTIVLYFHYLTPARREMLLATTHKNGLPIILIDEAALLHLAREHDTRLRPMFYVTLPYSALNPYFPFAAGLVPPEVYKGRRDLVRKLIDPVGPAIVYGGRQLGKSALLRQVQLEFHRPNNGQIVIYEDIKLIGDPASGKNYQNDFRDRLAHALVAQKLLEPSRSSLELDRLLIHLEQQLREKKIRLLLLLDEADHFLDADADRNFNIVAKLKNVMDQSERQFKIVLAGLHNVQRFQRIANQPLAHLGTPIEIGPLEPEPARQLLVEPLHALGFRFGNDPKVEDTSLVLHILSYTNYHPGLIQLFGSYLVDHVLSKYQHPARPPLPIVRKDVETVYRIKEVRDAIRERFTITLRLDARYEAITLALILEQWDDQNGFDRSYSPKQLRDLASTWWPAAFTEEISPDRFKGFLEEMRGLGVLSTSQDGNTYRLRSPNLVYLMGTRDEIVERMDFLSKSLPPEEGALESYHARLETGDFSPLTFAQERSVNSPKSGVAMIFGSNALGMGILSLALQRLLPDKNGTWTEIRVAARGAEAIQQQLKQCARENPVANMIIAYRELDGDSEKLADEVLGAVQFCGQFRGRTLRVCFALDTQAAWQWFQLPREKREALEERVEVVMSLKHWDRLGIKQRLEMEPGSEEEVPDRLVSKVHEVTGGWPYLLDEYMTRRKGNDTAETIDQFKQEFRDRESSHVRAFLSALGIYELLPRRVISALLDSNLQKTIREDASTFREALEWLALTIDGRSVEEVDRTVEYLRSLGIITGELRPEIDHIVARYWYES